MFAFPRLRLLSGAQLDSRPKLCRVLKFFDQETKGEYLLQSSDACQISITKLHRIVPRFLTTDPEWNTVPTGLRLGNFL